MTDKHNAARGAGHENCSTPAGPRGEPEPWGRLPKPKGRLWGLSRTTILEMCLRGEVKSTVIRKRGAVRGIRLIYMPSLAEALDGLAAKQTPIATTQEGGPAPKDSRKANMPVA
jgi:hypothetical protein